MWVAAVAAVEAVAEEEGVDVHQVHVVVGVARLGDGLIPQGEDLQAVGPRGQRHAGPLDVAHPVRRIVDVRQEDLAAAWEPRVHPVDDAAQPLADGGLPHLGLLDGAAIHGAVLGRLASVGVDQVVPARRDGHDALHVAAERGDPRHLVLHVGHRRAVVHSHVHGLQFREHARQLAAGHVGARRVVVALEQLEVAAAGRRAEAPGDAVAHAEQHGVALAPHPLERLGGHGRPRRATARRRRAPHHDVVVPAQGHQQHHADGHHVPLDVCRLLFVHRFCHW